MKILHHTIRVVILFLLVISNVNAFEIATHAYISHYTYQQSDLFNDASLISDLGLDLYDNKEPFGRNYSDFRPLIMDGSYLRLHTRQAYETFSKRYMKQWRDKWLSIDGWLMRGALQEDDLIIRGRDLQPKDDPVQMTRVLHHFYDPYFNRGLDSELYEIDIKGTSAINWAVGTNNAFDHPVTFSVDNESYSSNHFTIHRAIESMYSALTGHRSDGEKWRWYDDKEPETTDEELKIHWATTFRSLGNVIHLLQDMAQPLHTRNELHPWNRGHGENWYEWYIEARVMGGNVFDILSDPENPDSMPKYENLNEVSKVPLNPITYVDTSYPIPDFDYYSNYFTTANGQGALVARGKGLADYSNRGFFTPGTNIGQDNPYPLPITDLKAYQAEDVDISWKGALSWMTVYKKDVTDEVGPNQVAALTTAGVFTDKLYKQQFVISRANYDDWARLLIPRATAYSAGLINFFFRGRLTIEEMQEDCGELKITIKNTSKTGNAFYNGKFSVAYDATDGTRKLLPIVEGEEITEAAAIAPGETHEITAEYPYVLDRNKPKNLVVVFHGVIGQEPGIAAHTTDKVPDYQDGFVVTPAFVPGDGIKGARLVVKEKGQWKLCKTTNWAAGTIDWKGHYQSDKPTRTLSWSESSVRYYSSSKDRPYIYQFGKHWATAPEIVRGAAIYKAKDNKEWLIAISPYKVYKRLNNGSLNNGLYSKDGNPDGWQMIKDYYAESSLNQAAKNDPVNSSPRLFNGDGNESQFLYYLEDGTTVIGKIQITDDGQANYSERRLSPEVATYTKETKLCGTDDRTPPDEYVLSNLKKEFVSDHTVERLIAIDYSQNSVVYGMLGSQYFKDFQQDYLSSMTHDKEGGGFAMKIIMDIMRITISMRIQRISGQTTFIESIT